jgi:hypothetical protein
MFSVKAINRSSVAVFLQAGAKARNNTRAGGEGDLRRKPGQRRRFSQPLRVSVLDSV